MHKKPGASKPRASTAPQAGGHAVMRSRPAWRQTTQRGDSNINGQLATAIRIIQNFAHHFAHQK